MIRSATVLLGSNLGIAVLKLLRNVLLARLLTVEDFGIASTFAVVFALFEMLGRLGLDRLLIQAPDGEEPHLQATLHAIKAWRGFASGLLLFITAAPVAMVMKVPEVTWAFQLMAVLPIMQGLVHLDTSRMQRALRFGPFIKVTLAAEALTLAMIYPFYLIFGDYRVALYALLTQYLLMLGLSHAVAERRYRLGYDKDVARRALRFGWPLMVNAALLFAIFQGDRIIVANRLGVTDLGLFSLAFMLTLMAANILAQTQQTLFLPRLAPLQDRPEAFARMGRIVVQSGLVIGLLVAVGFAILGPDLVLIVFGDKYASALAALIWLSVMHAIRIAKSGASVVALARGETLATAVPNALRVLLLPVAWLVVGQGMGLLAVVWLAIIGETLGLAVALVLLRRWLRISLRGLGWPLVLWTGCLVLVCLDAVLAPPRPVILGNFHAFQIVLALALAGAALGMRDLRAWLLARLSELRAPRRKARE